MEIAVSDWNDPEFISSISLSDMKKRFTEELGFPFEELLQFKVKLRKLLDKSKESESKLRETVSLAKGIIGIPVSQNEFSTILQKTGAIFSDCKIHSVTVNENPKEFSFNISNKKFTLKNDSFLLMRTEKTSAFTYRIAPKSSVSQEKNKAHLVFNLYFDQYGKPKSFNILEKENNGYITKEDLTKFCFKIDKDLQNLSVLPTGKKEAKTPSNWWGE